MITSANLIEVAETLSAHSARGKLKETYRRRAISTAYYALFHALAELCALELIGSGRSKSPAWHRTYRALEHGFAKAALLDLARRLDDRNIKLITEAFVALQQFRHDADYDPYQTVLIGSDGPCIVIAQMAIQALDELPAKAKIELVACLLLKSRR